MCGIAGFANIDGQATKLLLTYALGRGIDDRGGHGCGFVSIHDGKVDAVKSGGEWKRASNQFITKAANSDLLLMHSRWATCGRRNQAKQAHPFTIKREGKAVLHGVHNGIIEDAWESAKKHNRHIDVDSEEIFHLIADQEYAALRQLNGYGIAMWVMADGNHIKLTRLTDSGEMVVIKLDDGGYVWASTWDILERALKVAGLKAKWKLNITEVGRVFEIYLDKVEISKTKGVKLVEEVSSWWSRNSRV